MSSRSFAFVRLQARLVGSDPGAIALLVVMPVVFMAFLQPLVALVGDASSSGAEHLISGIAVMFSFFVMTWEGLGFFLDHSWGTWDRIRASAARPVEVLIGKIVPYFVLGMLQLVVLFGIGMAAFGLRIEGPVTALIAVAACLVACVVMLGFALVAFCSTVEQHSAISNLCAILFGGIGGALAPVELLPGWLQAAAPFTPSYWAIEGFHGVLVGRFDALDVAGHCAALIGFAVVFGALALSRFRVGEIKSSWQ